MILHSSRVGPLVVGTLAAALLLGTVSCGGTSVLDLEVGQCIGDKSLDEDTVTSVPVVDCAQPHTGEIYALPQMADGDFPGDSAANDQAEEVCAGPAFEDYVGRSFDASVSSFSYLVPSAETWAEGDREIVCLLRDESGGQTTGSLRGSNR